MDANFPMFLMFKAGILRRISEDNEQWQNGLTKWSQPKGSTIKGIIDGYKVVNMKTMFLIVYSGIFITWSLRDKELNKFEVFFLSVQGWFATSSP